MCSKEIEVKNLLEKVLRMCVEDVKNEIVKKRSENKTIYCNHIILIFIDAKGKRG
jgi:hypothetical protein